MDMLNSDLQLKNDATAKRKKSGKHRQEHGESEAGFHFIAFVPALGKVWKFDGLERQPQGLGRPVIGCLCLWLTALEGNIPRTTG